MISASRQVASRPRAEPASMKAAITAGPQPRCPTTCSCAGTTTIRLSGPSVVAERLAGGSWGSPSVVSHRVGDRGRRRGGVVRRHDATRQGAAHRGSRVRLRHLPRRGSLPAPSRSTSRGRISPHASEQKISSAIASVSPPDDTGGTRSLVRSHWLAAARWMASGSFPGTVARAQGLVERRRHREQLRRRQPGPCPGSTTFVSISASSPTRTVAHSRARSGNAAGHTESLAHRARSRSRACWLLAAIRSSTGRSTGVAPSRRSPDGRGRSTGACSTARVSRRTRCRKG